MELTMRFLAAGAAAMAMANPAAGAGGSCVKHSPAHTVALVELYTSEGCNSCPPADAWLRSLRTTQASGGSAGEAVVPLSLHVDYWDYIGWKDRFADARFTARQRELASLSRGTVIYTPEVFVGLRERRNWSSDGAFRDAVRRVNAVPARASIRIELGKADAQGVEVKAAFRLAPGVTVPGAQAFLALYENGLSSEVKAGENRGVTLRHDAVVRHWVGPLALERGAAEFRRMLLLPAGAVAKNLGVSAFVQDAAGVDVLQATTLAACG